MTDLLSPEDKAAIAAMNQLMDRKRKITTTPEDISNMLKILTANEKEFQNYKAQAWFTKLAKIVTGQHGKMKDKTLASLGEMQRAVLGVLEELMDESEALREDIVRVLSKVCEAQERELRFRQIFEKMACQHDDQLREVDDTFRAMGNSMKKLEAGVNLAGSKISQYDGKIAWIERGSDNLQSVVAFGFTILALFFLIYGISEFASSTDSVWSRLRGVSALAVTAVCALIAISTHRRRPSE